MTEEELFNEMPRTRVPWVWLLLAALAGIGTLWMMSSPRVARHRSGVGSAGVGKALPSLSLRPLTFAGDVLSLDDIKGQVVVLNFWGTWCPPCRRELPHIVELAHHFQGHNKCRVLAVSCGSGEPDPVESLPDLHMATTELLAEMHFELPVYADPNARTRRAVNDAVGFQGYPTTLVLDAQSIVRGVWTGFAPGDEQEVADLVERLLAKES